MRKENRVQQALKPELTRFEKHLKLTISQNGVAHQLLTHQNRLRGKRLRPCLLFLCAKATGRVKPIHFDLATAVELIHNATLMHDDVLDEAKLRRDSPTFNALWGNETSILFGDMLFSHAFLTCAKIKSPRLFEVLTQTVNHICYGELLHTEQKFNLLMKEKKYLKIIRYKTASLFSVACYLGALFTTANRKLTTSLADYGLKFGMAYQIMDDYADLISDKRVTGKTTGTDLAKGKITLPLIHLSQFLSASQRHGLKRLIKQLVNQADSTNGWARKRKQIVRRLDKYQALDYALARARVYVQQAQAALQPLPDSSYKELLHALVDAVVL